MSTFQEMQDRIEDDLDRTDLNTQVKKAINRAIATYANESFWFTETSGTFSTVADQEGYGSGDGIPTDIREIQLVQITISSNDFELRPRTLEWIQEQDPGNNSGQPTDYVYFANQFLLYPIPSDAYTVTVFYDKNYDDLSASADTNDFTTTPEAEELIETRAEWWIYNRVLRDIEGAKLSKEAELEALQNLRVVSSNFTSLGNRNRSTDL